MRHLALFAVLVAMIPLASAAEPDPVEAAFLPGKRLLPLAPVFGGPKPTPRPQGQFEALIVGGRHAGPSMQVQTGFGTMDQWVRFLSHDGGVYRKLELPKDCRIGRRGQPTCALVSLRLYGPRNLARRIKVLDGTPGYPASVDAILTRLRAAYDVGRTQRTVALEHTLRTHRQALGVSHVQDSEEPRTLTYATWHQDAKQLEVRFETVHRSIGALTEKDTNYLIRHGALAGVATTLAAGGQVVSTRVLAPITFERERELGDNRHKLDRFMVEDQRVRQPRCPPMSPPPSSTQVALRVAGILAAIAATAAGGLFFLRRR